jgi:hypothetical protein
MANSYMCGTKEIIHSKCHSTEANPYFIIFDVVTKQTYTLRTSFEVIESLYPNPNLIEKTNEEVSAIN